MTNLAKLTAACATAGLSMAFFATAAFADSTDVVNTGNHVTVDNGSSSSTNVNVTNNNTANVSQSSDNHVNTGGNDANRNIGDTSVSTGNATVGNAFDTKVNSNSTNISNVGNTSNNSTTLTNTGDHVLLFGNGGDTTNVRVTNNNNADISQHASNYVNTGGNDANRNIGDVNIDTGNASVANVFSAYANKNVTDISGVGGHGHDSLDITNTGDHVTVGCHDAALTLLFLNDFEGNGCGDSTNINVRNHNDADISQDAYNKVNTGKNDANRNISLDGDVSIMTGTASVGNLFSAWANANGTAINGTGLFDTSHNDTTITNTGDHLDVNGTGSSFETNVHVTNNNDADISQYSHNYVNTGHNDANRNISTNGFGGLIDSGNAGLANAFMAMANWNWTSVGGNALWPEVFSWWI